MSGQLAGQETFRILSNFDRGAHDQALGHLESRYSGVAGTSANAVFFGAWGLGPGTEGAIGDGSCLRCLPSVSAGSLG